MREIARSIQIGAKAYLNRQFRTVAVFMAVLTVLLFFALPVPENAAHSEFALRFGRSVAFILGAAFSAITGYTGMWLAVRANVRTANAAKESACDEPCGSRSAPAGWRGCSRSGSGSWAPP
jgi:K(+)-stimulated pyrophosphate-energized sodium pump